MRRQTIAGASSFPGERGDQLLCVEVGDSPVQGGSGHAEIACDMGGGLALFDESAGVGDLAVAENRSSSAEVEAGGAAFGVGVVDAFAFDLELHLREGSHHGEDHGSHGCAGVDVPPAEVQDSQVHLLSSKFIGQGEHVGSGAAEAIECGDDQSVAFM